MNKAFTEEQLRTALGNALITLNRENMNNANQQELVILNKVGLKLIYHILNELDIKIDG